MGLKLIDNRNHILAFALKKKNVVHQQKTGLLIKLYKTNLSSIVMNSPLIYSPRSCKEPRRKCYLFGPRSNMFGRISTGN